MTQQLLKFIAGCAFLAICFFVSLKLLPTCGYGEVLVRGVGQMGFVCIKGHQ